MSFFQKRLTKTLWRSCSRQFLSLLLVMGVLMGSVSFAAPQPLLIEDQTDPLEEVQYSTGWDDGWDSPLPGDADGKFTIAIIPDTQEETTTTFHRENMTFLHRMNWLVSQKSALDIRFVGHTGDVVNWDTEDHLPYIYASNAYVPMDTAGIPFLLALGNHDTGAVFNGGSAYEPNNTTMLARKTTSFNKFFPVSRFPLAINFEKNKIDNSYVTFKAAGTKWLAITLELWARYEAIDWAKSVVEAHPDYNVIILTHAYLTGSAGIQDNNGGYGTSKPTEVFNQLVKQYPNIKFVFSGHTGMAGRREDTGVNGNKIVSVLGTFHSGTTNPVQLMEIDVNANTASTRFYAPFTNQNWDSQYKWTFSGMNFVTPSSEKPRLSDLLVLAQKHKQHDYTPASWTPMAQALSTAISVRDNASATEQQVVNAITALSTAEAGLVKNPAATGYNWEFNTTADTEGWTATKIEDLYVSGGSLTGEAYHATNPLDARIQSPALQLDPSFSILRFRARITNPNYNDFNGGTVYFNRVSDGSAFSASRAVAFPTGMTVKGNVGFAEYVIDLSQHASWNGTIGRIWIETIRGVNGTKMEIDYIRLHRKGTSTLTYNANAGSDTVTNMPLNDTVSANVIGYLPSGQIPMREGYAFQGWADTPDGDPVSTISIAGDKTVYATWASASVVGFAAEFEDPSELNLWIGNVQRKVIEDGALQLELEKKDARLQYVFTTGEDGKDPLSSEYNLMKIRYKKPVAADTAMVRWQRIGDAPGDNDVVTAAQNGRQYNYYFRTAGNDNWYEKTYDLTFHQKWNGDIRSIWLDPCEKGDASASSPGIIEYDYIRFYRKGDNTVSYEKNTAANVSNMPENDTMASSGTGYLLSGHKPNCVGYVFNGWSLSADGEVVANNAIDLYGDVTLYAIWTEAQPVTATFDVAGATGTAPDPITVGQGAPFVFPQASGLSKPDHLFVGWSDGAKTYQPGQNYILNEDKTFVAVWSSEISSPIIGKAWEFNTAGSVEGWAGAKVSSFIQSNGNLSVTIGSNEPYYDSRLSSPNDLQLDPAFSIMRFRTKINGTTIPDKSCTVFFTRYIDDINEDGDYGILENDGPRESFFNQIPGNVYVEYTIDLSQNAFWNASVARLWLDPVRAPSGTKIDIDYIRFYRKGTRTLNYNANAAGSNVTGMPANDTMASMGIGYPLSGQIPVRAGYTFLGWSDTPDGQVIANNTINISENVTNVYARWRSAEGEAVATFEAGGAFGNPPYDISAPVGQNITLPSPGLLSKPGHKFAGWSDGTTVYAAGASYPLTVDVTFTATWEIQTDLPVMGKSWEFNTPGSIDGWVNVQKFSDLYQSNGYLVGVSDVPVGDPRGYDCRIASPDNLQLDPAYSILKYRARIVGTPTRDASVFFTRYIDDLNGDGVYGIAENGVRNKNYVVEGGGVFKEYTLDLSEHGEWTSNVARIWMDTLLAPIGSYFEIDYIRLYRKGNSSLTYNPNAGGATVTNMPANDAFAAAGTGYMLSGQIPLRSGYVFDGWTATPGGDLIETVDIAGATTVYAKWREAVVLTATFVLDPGVTGTAPAPIVKSEYDTFTLPGSSGFSKQGLTFLGWSDGEAIYPAGASYSLGVEDVTFYATWLMQDPVFLPANGSTNVDFRNLAIQITFPVDIDADTLTPENIDLSMVQRVDYDSATKTATVYLKPQSLYYGGKVEMLEIKNIFSADRTMAIAETSYTINLRSSQPEDGENLVSNGDFELPFISAYNVASMSLSDDTPTGTGKSLKLSAGSQYTQPKFNVFVKPGANYFVEFDAKILNNMEGDPVLNGRVHYAYRVYKEDGTGEEDKPFGGVIDIPTNLTPGEGWVHYSGYMNESSFYPSLVQGPAYMFVFTDPNNGIGVDFLLDNLSVREAYAINFVSEDIGVPVTGTFATDYKVKGSTITLPESGFSASGFTLIGWTDGMMEYDLGEIYEVPVGGATFTAIWDIGGVTQYSVTFAANGDDVTGMPQAYLADEGSYITVANIGAPERDGFTFLGWSTDGETVLSVAQILVSSDIQFIALWDEIQPEPIGLLGDADNDGSVSSFDAVSILRITAGTITPTDVQLVLSDVDGDGSVTSYDAVLLLQHIAHVDTGFPIGQPIYND